MDIRSFSLNFEVNAVIYSAATTRRLEEAFENDMTKCTLITRKLYEQRSLLVPGERTVLPAVLARIVGKREISVKWVLNPAKI